MNYQLLNNLISFFYKKAYLHGEYSEFLGDLNIEKIAKKIILIVDNVIKDFSNNNENILENNINESIAYELAKDFIIEYIYSVYNTYFKNKYLNENISYFHKSLLNEDDVEFILHDLIHEVLDDRISDTFDFDEGLSLGDENYPNIDYTGEHYLSEHETEFLGGYKNISKLNTDLGITKLLKSLIDDINNNLSESQVIQNINNNNDLIKFYKNIKNILLKKINQVTENLNQNRKDMIKHFLITTVNSSFYDQIQNISLDDQLYIDEDTSVMQDHEIRRDLKYFFNSLVSNVSSKIEHNIIKNKYPYKYNNEDIGKIRLFLKSLYQKINSDNFANVLINKLTEEFL